MLQNTLTRHHKASKGATSSPEKPHNNMMAMLAEANMKRNPVLLKILAGRPFCWNVYKDDDHKRRWRYFGSLFFSYIIYFKHQLGTYIYTCRRKMLRPSPIANKRRWTGLLSNSGLCQIWAEWEAHVSVKGWSKTLELHAETCFETQ